MAPTKKPKKIKSDKEQKPLSKQTNGLFSEQEVKHLLKPVEPSQEPRLLRSATRTGVSQSTAASTSHTALSCPSTSTVTTTTAAWTPDEVQWCDISDANFSLATSVFYPTTASNTSHTASLCASMNTVTATPESKPTTSSGKISGLTPAELKTNSNINWTMLSELECPVCLEFMLPPIYQCMNGHSTCEPCKDKLTKCPVCRSNFQASKNVVLDKITQHMIYPCKFYKSGCRHSGKADRIRHHEDRCEVKPYDCPLKGESKCNWNGEIAKLFQHVEIKHDSTILKGYIIDLPFARKKQQKKKFLIKHMGEFFKCTFKYKFDMFRWHVRFVGPACDAKFYKFEVHIIDLTPAGKRCSFTGLVAPLRYQNDRFTSREHDTVYFWETLKDFITDSFKFKVRILKE